MDHVFLVWVDNAYDSRDFYGCFSTEERAQDWINSNLEPHDVKYAYVEHQHID